MKYLEHLPQKNSNDPGYVLQYGPILAVLNTTKIQESEYFTPELGLDINYSSRFEQYPPIQLLVVCVTLERWPTTVTAKALTSWLKE